MTNATCDERPDLKPLLDVIKDQLRVDYGAPHVKRDAHPKMHGLVQAILDVDDRDDEVPALPKGVLGGPRRSYPAWVRFSNSFGIQHDLEFETRGMAIKVLNAGDDRDQHQDFVLATHDAFFLPNTKHYREFFAAAHSGSSLAVLLFFVRHRLVRGLAALARSTFVLAMNPLAITYCSQTPYHFGPNRFVKVRARPRITPALKAALPHAWSFRLKAILANIALAIKEARGSKVEAEGWCERYFAPRDLLRLSMTSFLASHDAAFDIEVQLWPEGSTPPDDATRRWSEEHLPYRHVATLRIPRQVCSPIPGMPEPAIGSAKDLVDLGEVMSFNPWHTLPDHEPYGEINCARRHIYREIADFRHEANRVIDPCSKLAPEYDRIRADIRLDQEPLR